MEYLQVKDFMKLHLIGIGEQPAARRTSSLPLLLLLQIEKLRYWKVHGTEHLQTTSWISSIHKIISRKTGHHRISSLH